MIILVHWSGSYFKTTLQCHNEKSKFHVLNKLKFTFLIVEHSSFLSLTGHEGRSFHSMNSSRRGTPTHSDQSPASSQPTSRPESPMFRHVNAFSSENSQASGSGRHWRHWFRQEATQGMGSIHYFWLFSKQKSWYVNFITSYVEVNNAISCVLMIVWKRRFSIMSFKRL